MRCRARARRIRMILTDVDGTLTDGTLAVLPDGEEVKAYHVKDGVAVLLAQIVGLKLGIITGKRSPGLEKRAERLKISELHQGVINKLPVFEDILARHGLRPEEVAYIGDDLGDLEVLRRAGLAGAVADAHPAVRKAAHFVCRAEGGRGAYREFVEFIITAQKKWDVVTAGLRTLFDRSIYYGEQ
jgi:3-deoxy-D-manno-octulosonate 8-phosphate phosphatase (KDO 8-P phosphatase)